MPLEDVIRLTRVAEVGLAQIRQAWEIAARYLHGHYDSLIVATALSAGCSVLYTGDMQDGQVFEGRLTLDEFFFDPARVYRSRIPERLAANEPYGFGVQAEFGVATVAARSA